MEGTSAHAGLWQFWDCRHDRIKVNMFTSVGRRLKGRLVFSRRLAERVEALREELLALA